MAGSNYDEKYWREHHTKQPYAGKDAPFEDFEPAYRTGSEAAQRHAGKKFEDIENDLALQYEKNKGDSALPWDRALPAVRSAWDRIGGVISPRDPDRGIRSGM